MSARRGLLVLSGAALLLLAVWLTINDRPETATLVAGISPAVQSAATRADTANVTDARATADRAIRALQARDGAALALLVHPTGVRFSPSAHVDVATDQVLRPSEVALLWTDQRLRTWGSTEASDEPISLTPANYAQRYIIDRDYSAATVSMNGDTNRGTTVDNSIHIYPGATRFEYFLPGNDATDWSALRIIVVRSGSEWKLVAIIHDAWAP